MSGRARGERGQASVELVAFLPLVVAVVLAVAQLLAGGAARELAGHAAEAGAVALLQGADAEAAAREAVPGWSRGRLRVRVEERRVQVRLRPRAFVPGLAGLLETTGAADAGPAPR
jgi:nitrogen fixation protein FixH